MTVDQVYDAVTLRSTIIKFQKDWFESSTHLTFSLPAMSLCPGYHQVTQFRPEDDYEEEEEIIYITLELGNVEPTLIPSCDGDHLVGLDTPTPFLQLAGTVLKGRHETLGTESLFSEHEGAACYMESTRQRICFREVRLEEKGKAKAKPKRANLCWIALLGNSHLYHAGAGLERRRSFPSITDAIVHTKLYRLQLHQNHLCICNGDFAWIFLDRNRLGFSRSCHDSPCKPDISHPALFSLPADSYLKDVDLLRYKYDKPDAEPLDQALIHEMTMK
ncbi:hypothetical protein EDD18DRAFT_1458648 [Armillaria luteobubalina]|uniref:Transcription factor TFIIIC triple barrel domain-containing protein n=1 Tax=Armillaria luteobubalina TaxID=153913 RepID=A0AA39QGG3_9AGAR|nr:hypothetical protein EDD18DRAFT_1458648 [Armillaria luteobubalina]